MTNRYLMMGASVGLLLALGACSNTAEMDSLKSQIASAQATANAADQKATQALAEAQAASAAADLAAADAAEASRKADEIFRAGLRK
ncbi:MAG: Lpp/OprI family alanine-zipper lipoprotein [Geminicoccaceae bacterium]